MNHASLEPSMSGIQPLFAVERELVPEPYEVRVRLLKRARASLLRDLCAAPHETSPSSRRIGISVAAATAVVSFALCAAAFLAGHGITSRSATMSVKSSMSLRSGGMLPAATPSVAVKLLPVVPPSSRFLSIPGPALGVSPFAPTGRSVSAKTANSDAADIVELRLLQTAQHGVILRDFEAALSAISEHKRRFPSGKLSEEREVLRLKVLLGLRRGAEARRAGAAFRQHFPRSALVGRIDEIL